MISAPDFRLARAISSVGSSRKRPFRNTRSASDSKAATDGAGSKVCELTPSGTTPCKRMRLPPMFSTMLVMGDTVATTDRAPAAGVSASAVASGSDRGTSTDSGSLAQAASSVSRMTPRSMAVAERILPPRAIQPGRASGDCSDSRLIIPWHPAYPWYPCGISRKRLR